MNIERIAENVAMWVARSSTVTDPDIIRALKREGFNLRRGFWVKTFNFDPDGDPEFEETWRAEMNQGNLFFRGRHEGGRQRGWSGALRKDMWPRSLQKFAGRGNQVRRKDKDQMRDTGGVSKGRDREPHAKPPRDDVKNRHREKRLDKDRKKDREEDDREFKKPNRRTSRDMNAVHTATRKWDLRVTAQWDDDKISEYDVQELLLDKVPERLSRSAKIVDVRIKAGLVDKDGVAKGPKAASGPHPLDCTQKGAWEGLEMPEQNYHRQVYSALWGIIESDNGISEKDFAKQDDVKTLCDGVIRSDEAEDIIQRFGKQGCRPAYCAESIFDQMRGE